MKTQAQNSNMATTLRKAISDLGAGPAIEEMAKGRKRIISGCFQGILATGIEINCHSLPFCVMHSLSIYHFIK
jgi:hypothetical protein